MEHTRLIFQKSPTSYLLTSTQTHRYIHQESPHFLLLILTLNPSPSPPPISSPTS
jgi:hypothetical protein